jgi:hypothetical protein
MPRAGNTLLGSLFNTTDYIKLSPNSVLPDILYNVLKIKQTDLFKNFPNHKSLDNVIDSVFFNYYKNWDVENIIDRGPWGEFENLNLLKQMYVDPKIIILYRPVLEVLASFAKVEKGNVEERCDQLMGKKGFVFFNLISIKNILENHKNYLIIKYNDLVGSPLTTCQKILNFLEIKKTFELKKFNQYSINEIKYKDDETEKGDIHKIRLDSFLKLNYSIEKYLSLKTINKYKNLDVL